MQSKNKKQPSAKERRWIQQVKDLPCSVCDAFGCTEVHEQKQGQWYTSVALCSECHRDPIMGWHGEKRAWKIRKMDEIDALNITIRRIVDKGIAEAVGKAQ